MDGLDLTPFLVGLLVFARVAAMFMALPITGNAGVPRTTRLAVALPLAAVLVPTAAEARLPDTVPHLVTAVAGEVILGVAMGFVLALLSGAVSMASEIISNKIGLTMASMLDPMTGAQGSTLGALAQLLATGVFFSLDLHLDCVRALSDSLRALPPGRVVNPLGAGNVLFEVTDMVVTLGVQLAGPLLFFSMLLNLGMMILGKMAPGLQLFFSIGMSFTIVAGVVLLGAALPAMLHVEAAVLQEAWEPIRRIVTEMAGG